MYLIKVGGIPALWLAELKTRDVSGTESTKSTNHSQSLTNILSAYLITT